MPVPAIFYYLHASNKHDNLIQIGLSCRFAVNICRRTVREARTKKRTDQRTRIVSFSSRNRSREARSEKHACGVYTFEFRTEIPRGEVRIADSSARRQGTTRSVRKEEYDEGRGREKHQAERLESEIKREPARIASLRIHRANSTRKRGINDGQNQCGKRERRN